MTPADEKNPIDVIGLKLPERDGLAADCEQSWSVARGAMTAHPCWPGANAT
jgi:hypothetical protein